MSNSNTYSPDRNSPVIVQVRDSLECLLGLRRATGTVTFSSTPAEVPHVNDTVIISDGVEALTYKWVAAASAAYDITIPATATLAAAALAGAINSYAPADAEDRVRGVTASVAALVVTVTNTVSGTLGNVAIAGTNNHQTPLGMSGGTDGLTLASASVAIIKAVTTAGTAEGLAAEATLATYVEVTAKKTAGDNTGNVFIGAVGLDQGSAEGVEMLPGDTWWRQARPGECFDLADIYIDADTSADGVAGYYVPA